MTIPTMLNEGSSGGNPPTPPKSCVDDYFGDDYFDGDYFECTWSPLDVSGPQMIIGPEGFGDIQPDGLALWNDRHLPNENAAQTTVGLRPQIAAYGTSGFDAPVFDGVDDKMDVAPWFSFTTEFTLAIAFRHDAGGDDRSGLVGHTVQVWTWDDGSVRFFMGSSGVVVLFPAGSIVPGAYYRLLIFRDAAGNITARLNGVLSVVPLNEPGSGDIRAIGAASLRLMTGPIAAVWSWSENHEPIWAHIDEELPQ